MISDKVFKLFLRTCIVALFYTFISLLADSPSVPEIPKILDGISLTLKDDKFYLNLISTLKIVASGILLASLAGVPIALVTSMNCFARELIMPIINVIKSIPSISMFPVFIVIMGIGDKSRIFVIFWNSIYAIVSSTIYGLESIDKNAVEAAEVDGASEINVYLKIRFPLALVNIMEGLKIAVSNGFVAIVVAEMLGATKGLGYMIVWSSNAFRYSEMYSYILAISLIGCILTALIEASKKLIERKIYD